MVSHGLYRSCMLRIPTISLRYLFWFSFLQFHNLIQQFYQQLFISVYLFISPIFGVICGWVASLPRHFFYPLPSYPFVPLPAPSHFYCINLFFAISAPLLFIATFDVRYCWHVLREKGHIT